MFFRDPVHCLSPFMWHMVLDSGISAGHQYHKTALFPLFHKHCTATCFSEWSSHHLQQAHAPPPPPSTHTPSLPLTMCLFNNPIWFCHSHIQTIMPRCVRWKSVLLSLHVSCHFSDLWLPSSSPTTSICPSIINTVYSGGVWSQSEPTLAERHGTLWTGPQSITGL